MEGAPVEFDREAAKAGFGSAADWKTQGGMAKPVNVGPTRGADTYLQKQKQLTSSVLEQTDYYQYLPMKKKQEDMNNFGHVHKPKAQGLKQDSEFANRDARFEKSNANYDPKEMVNKTLGSVFDKPVTVSKPAV